MFEVAKCVGKGKVKGRVGRDRNSRKDREAVESTRRQHDDGFLQDSKWTS